MVSAQALVMNMSVTDLCCHSCALMPFQHIHMTRIAHHLRTHTSPPKPSPQNLADMETSGSGPLHILLPNAHTTSPLMPDTANPSSSQSQFKTPTSVTLRSSPPPSLYPSYSHPPLHTSLPQPHPPACGMSKLPSIPASPSTNTRALLIYEKGVQGRD